MATEKTDEMWSAGSIAGDAFKRYPGTAALFGLGIGWFLFESMRHRSDGEEALSEEMNGEPFREIEKKEPEEEFTALKHSGDFRASALEKSRHARETVSRVIDERPLLVGIAGLTAGILIGAVTSGYMRENQFLGETKETIRKSARWLLQETKEKAEHVLDVARRAASEEAERQRLFIH